MLTTTMAPTAANSAGKMASRWARMGGKIARTASSSHAKVTTVPVPMAATAPHAVTRLE